MSSNIQVQRICEHCCKGFTARTTVTRHCGDAFSKKAQAKYNKPSTGCIRGNLKELPQKELEQLPGTFNELETAQRLNVLCKLMPYVLPKVESVRDGQTQARVQYR